MRRSGILVSVFALVLVGVGSLTWRPGLAQDGTPVPMAGHPIVGSWVLDPDGDDPSNPPATAIFHDDGTYIEVDADGSTGVGSWEATGPTTAAVTFLYHALDESGAISSVTVWATVAVGATTDALTADYTIEFVGPDGVGTGQLGPGTASGARIAVAPMGQPVGPLTAPDMATPAA